MKIIFAGTPEFAVPTLQALLNSEHQVIAVYTQPDRPAGRGQKLTASPVKELALKNNIPVYQPISLRDADAQAELKKLNAEVMIVVAYGLILPQAVLTMPQYGCINVHASLLPRWRGAAPIQRAILAGDQETGVTLMQMDAGLDTGAMLQKVTCKINSDETSASLHERLAILGGPALLETLAQLKQNKLKPFKQDHTLATYAAKIEKKAAEINWEKSAVEIDRLVRAFNPWPIAFAHYQNEIIRIWKSGATTEKTSAKPGAILQVDKNGIQVATGNGILTILELQLPGGKHLAIADFLNARKDYFLTGEDFAKPIQNNSA